MKRFMKIFVSFMLIAVLMTGCGAKNKMPSGSETIHVAALEGADSDGDGGFDGQG